MQLISLNKFKSYETVFLNRLHPRFNVFVGRNGEGKSNFFKAITFAITDKDRLNRQEFNNFAHKQIDINSGPNVQISIRPQNNAENLYSMKRSWVNFQTEHFSVDERIVSKEEYQNFLESMEYPYSNPYNIIHQGRVIQLCKMNQFDLFSILEQASGLRRYQKRWSQAQFHMKAANNTREQVQTILKEIQTKLKSYENKRKDFQMFEQAQKFYKARHRMDYISEANNIQIQIKNIKKIENQYNFNISELRNKGRSIQLEIQDIETNISVKNRQIVGHLPEQPVFQKVNNQQLQNLKKKLKKIQQERKNLQKQRANINKQSDNYYTKQVKPNKDKCQAMQKTDQAIKDGKSKQELKKLIQQLSERKKNVEDQLSKLQKHKNDLKLKGKHILSLNGENVNKYKQQIMKISGLLKQLKIKYFEVSRSKNKAQSQIQILVRQKSMLVGEIRKRLPLMDLQLLQTLRKNQVKGIFGYFAEFLQIQPSVLFAYQSVGLHKLCTLLVEDQKACEEVVKYLKASKGKQVNILPLSALKRIVNQSRPNVKVDDCFVLTNKDWITIRPHEFGNNFTGLIQKLINSTFGGSCLVKDYDTGLKVARQYHMTCVTADKELIYPQALLCRLGKDRCIEDKFQCFYSYRMLEYKLRQVTQNLVRSDEQLKVLKTEQIELMRGHAQLQSKINIQQQNLLQKKEYVNSCNRMQMQQAKLKQQIQKLKSQIKSKQEVLQDKNIKVNQNELKQLRQRCTKLLSKYNQLCERQSEIEIKIAHLQQQQQDLKNKITSAEQNKQLSLSYEGCIDFKKKLQQQIKILQNKKYEILKNLKQIQFKIQQTQKQGLQIAAQLSHFISKLQFVKQKIKQIGQIQMISREQLQQFSNSLSAPMSKQGFKHFTAAQKLLFSQLSDWFKQAEKLNNQLQQIKAEQNRVKQLAHNLEQQKKKHIDKSFAVFQQNFGRIFKSLTLQGKSDIRLQTKTQKNRGITHYRRYLSVNVSFKQNLQFRPFHQYSDGQKTVIGLCILLALQRMQPAPFYILDQFDAALDTEYQERIHNMLINERGSQYFISSFKQATIDFGQNCNYFRIYSVEGNSKIEQINRETALRIIRQQG